MKTSGFRIAVFAIVLGAVVLGSHGTLSSASAFTTSITVAETEEVVLSDPGGTDGSNDRIPRKEGYAR